MNLTTHWILAVALGIAFFHNVEIAMMMGIGALIPDLDREYLFVAKSYIERNQLHRSLFHNFFVIGILYFINPFLSLGALTHSLLDMFTSATDRGAEVLYPLTRVVKGFRYTIDGKPQGPTNKMEWWVEDPWSLLKETSDRDLQEPTGQAWRRSYGPFKNSRIVDWGIFFASIVFLVACYLALGSSLFAMSGFRPLSLVSFGGIAIFYGLGEWWRRKLIKTKSEETNWIVLGILIVGLVVFVAGGLYLFSPPAVPNLTLAGLGVLSVFVGFVISYLFVRVRRKNEDWAL